MHLTLFIARMRSIFCIVATMNASAEYAARQASINTGYFNPATTYRILIEFHRVSRHLSMVLYCHELQLRATDETNDQWNETAKNSSCLTPADPGISGKTISPSTKWAAIQTWIVPINVKDIFHEQRGSMQSVTTYDCTMVF